MILLLVNFSLVSQLSVSISVVCIQPVSCTFTPLRNFVTNSSDLMCISPPVILILCALSVLPLRYPAFQLETNLTSIMWNSIAHLLINELKELSTEIVKIFNLFRHLLFSLSLNFWADLITCAQGWQNQEGGLMYVLVLKLCFHIQYDCDWNIKLRCDSLSVGI